MRTANYWWWSASPTRTAKSKRQSLVLVPRDTPGVEMLRNLPVFDHLSPTNTHPEFTLTNVRVPVENLLGEQGAGFAIGQARLGPARLHHCMRAIGECEVLISLMVMRSQERSTFGKRIDDYSSTQAAISCRALSWINVVCWCNKPHTF